MKEISVPSKNRRPIKEPALCTVGVGGMMKVWHSGISETRTNSAESRELLRTLSVTHRIFTASKLGAVLRSLDARHFEATLSGKRLIRIRLDGGSPIYGTRKVIPASDRGYQDLCSLHEYCLDHGVALGSASWTSEQFLRSTIPKRLRFHSPISKGARGGRKGYHTPGTYGDTFYVDIRSAYPSAMISEPVPELLEQDMSGDFRENPVGLALARVTVPDWLDPWPPLYEQTRFGMLWRTGEIRGWFPYRELRMAEDSGCKVRPEIGYSGKGYVEPFGEWLRIMLDMRTLPGGAGAFAKVIANSLWGSFANHSVTRVVRFADPMGHRIESEIVRRPPPPEAGYIATEIAGRVRERMFRELVPEGPVYLDTDGGVLRAGSAVPEPSGPELGEWSVRERFDRFELVGVGAYAGSRPDDSMSIVLSGFEGEATLADVRNYGGAVADTSRTGFKGARVQKRIPWIFDESGEPVPINPGRWPLDVLPDSWSAIPVDLAGVPGFEPQRISDLRDGSASFPISF